MFENKHIYYRFVVLLLLSVSISAIAQELRSSMRVETNQLLQYYRSLKDLSQRMLTHNALYEGKCGFGMHAQVLARWKELTQAQRTEFSLLMQADVMQCDTVAGHFHIFYDTTGNNEPALLDNNNQRIPGTAKAYIDSVARIFNHVWDVEVTQMGYTQPPSANGQSYDVYVEDIGYYGLTTPIGLPINGTDIPPQYQSYITVDNDYQENGYKSNGISGLKVTAAHEFHHAIQYGYGFWADDLFAYELTSTWFEDVVYTEVNDYYNWVPLYFSQFSQGLSFNYYENPDYGERCIWAHFLATRFNPSIMRDVWTRMRTQPFLESTDAALGNIGSNLQQHSLNSHIGIIIPLIALIR